MLILDAHLDLSWNALGWNRDLDQTVAQIRKSEAGMHGKRRGATTRSHFLICAAATSALRWPRCWLAAIRRVALPSTSALRRLPAPPPKANSLTIACWKARRLRDAARLAISQSEAFPMGTRQR